MTAPLVSLQSHHRPYHKNKAPPIEVDRAKFAPDLGVQMALKEIRLRRRGTGTASGGAFSRLPIENL
jgi:hypothetical protein